MATQPTSTDRLSSEQPSLILALNARYEAAWAEYNRLEQADYDDPKEKGADSPEWMLHTRVCQAMETNQEEIDALRLAILYQLPTTWEEALVLAAHVHGTYDIDDAFRDIKKPSPERQAFESGLHTLLDFMFGELATSPALAGTHMRSLENIVLNRRRFREARPEDLTVQA